MGDFNLTGRKALVTGSARGIGAAIAQALAAAGADVMISDIDPDTGRQTAANIAKSGVKTGFVQFDVTDESGWETAVAATVTALGGFDILVNNAGIEITALVIDIDPVKLNKMLDVNITGTALGMKHAFRAMRPGGAAGKGGAIVNIASVAANTVTPSIAGYSATKSAVDRLTRVAAAEAGRLGYGVRVNCIYPGLVATDMGVNLAHDFVSVGLAPDVTAAMGSITALTPLGRLGAVDEMADAVVFLCTDAARFITGTGLAVDGGMGS